MKMKRATVVVAAVLAGIAVCQGRIITVDDYRPADFSTIQAAIDDSNEGDTVLVADGRYTGAGNRDINFHGKAITVKSQNGPENCIIDCNGTESDGHRGVYFHSEEDPNSALIGFTITNGYPPGEDPLNRPPFTRVYLGGAIRCKDASPVISHCIITGNRAKKGGGIYLGGGAPKVSNCTIADNYAVDWGGGMAVNSSDAEIRNCIIWDNSAPSSPQIYNSGSGSPTVAYSDVQGGWPGTGNIDVDPCFAEPNTGDYHLKSQGGRYDPNGRQWTIDNVTSPCIDAGDPMSPIALEPFPNGGRINIGAYGGIAEASKSYFEEPPCEVIVAGDINGDCTVDFLDFRLMALHWLEDNSPPYVPPVIPDYIEFYVQTDKAEYHLGEDVEILYRVTNLGDEEVTITCSRSGPFNLWVQKNDETIWALAHVFHWDTPGVEFSAGESKELRHTWDMKDDDGNLVTPGIYDVVGVMYTFPPTEVEVQIDIIP